MSLVTRCTACATLFRVAQDQLRASDGWVRCGRCDTVFDALESLDDQQAQAPAELSPRSAAEAGGPDEQALAEPIDVDALLKRRVEAQIVKPAAASEAVPAAAVGNGVEPATGPDPAPAAPDPAIGSPEPPVPPRPEFVRRADSDARWHSPAMRAALAGTSIILLLVLGAQVAYHHRDQLAARSPLAAGLLDAACTRWNCVIQAPRRLDAVVIQHSALSRVPERPGALQLSLRIANRNDIDVAMPAVELSLTDAAGQPIARRALLPGDFGAEAQATIAARTERPLQLMFTTGEHIVSGFSVELFHP